MMLVYDCTDRKSFDDLERWREEMVKHADASAVCVLVGNKVEAGVEKAVSTEEGQAFVDKHAMGGFFEVSAKVGTNVHAAFLGALTKTYHAVTLAAQANKEAEAKAAAAAAGGASSTPVRRSALGLGTSTEYSDGAAISRHATICVAVSARGRPLEPELQRVVAALGGVDRVAAIYRDESASGEPTLQLKLPAPDIATLTAYRDQVLSGEFDSQLTAKLATELSALEALETPTEDLKLRADRSQFAQTFETGLRRLAKLTAHQQERYEEVGEAALVHLTAPAGGGKTFVALFHILRALAKRLDVLFISGNKALCVFVSSWLATRIDNPVVRVSLLRKLHVLYRPFEEGVRSITGIRGQMIQWSAPTEPSRPDKFGLVVIDEAHHIFCDPELTAQVQLYYLDALSDDSKPSRKGAKRGFAPRVIVLSDEGQATFQSRFPDA